MTTPAVAGSGSQEQLKSPQVGAPDTLAPVSPAPAASPETGGVAPQMGTAGTPAATAPSPDSTPSGPYDLPAEFRSPQIPALPTGPLADAERQQLEYYRQQAQQNGLRDQERNLDDYQRQAMQHYIQEGQDETTARLLAQAHRTERQAALQREMELRGTLQDQQRVSQESMAVARQFNVNPSVLAGFQRREDMVRYASLVRFFGDYRKNTESRLSALEKGRVPEQQFASGGAQGAAGTNSYGQMLKDGKKLPSAAEIDRITARYSQG